MAASGEYRLDEMSIKEKEKSDDVSLFIDFDAANLNLELEVTSDSESENPLMPDTRSIINGPDPGANDILNSENTTDYDWLLSPPRNTAPSLEMEDKKNVTSHKLISNGQSTSSESRLENLPVNRTSTTNIAPKLPGLSNGVKSSNATIRRPSPSRKAPSTGSRSSTPTTRPVVPSTTKPLRSSTPTSRATVAAIKPVPPSKRSITPTARPSITSAASKPTSRSSTPTARPSISAAKSASRSSTPTSTIRPSIISASKSTSRSSTPTSRPSNPSGLLATSVNRDKPSSAMKVLAPSRGSSPSVKSRPSKNPPETLQSVKKSLPERSASASKARPGPPTVNLNVSETNLKAVPKRSSCSPSRGQALNGSVKPVVMRSRGYSNGNDDVNPVLMGTKMVERVVNMRKLAPPREDHVTDQNITSGKLSVSQDKGFGRSLSKKSFDMALRHLDIRRSMPGNMRAMITKVPASSVYSVISESIKTDARSASDSPLATCSSASSGLSENGHSYH